MTITIDIGCCRTPGDIHKTIAEALGFPDHYGQNWDAFDECIRDFPPGEALEIQGIEKLANALLREAELLIACLAACEDDLPGFQWQAR